MCNKLSNMYILASSFIIFTFVPFIVVGSKINCDLSVDAAVWAHDKESDSIYVFSDRYYYLWDIANRNLSERMVVNETWPGLPAKLNAACSFYDSTAAKMVYLFLKDDRYWLYRGFELHVSNALNHLFSSATPRDTNCFTCDVISGNEVGIKAISRSSYGSFACTADFINNQFVQRKCSLSDEDLEEPLKKAMKKAGHCQAYASKYAYGELDFVYFGSDAIAIAKKKNVQFEPLTLVVDCNPLWFLPQVLNADANSIIVCTAFVCFLIMVLCSFMIWCVCRSRDRKNYEEDSEGDFSEKPATAPAITAEAPNET